MAAISTWSTTAASNNATPPDGFPENMNPSDVNNSAREVMAAVRTQMEEGGFFDYGHTITRIDDDEFRVDASHGDQTAVYTVGRRVKIADSSTLYGRITAVTFSTTTDVTVVLDSGVISVSISAVSVGPDIETRLGLINGEVQGPFITNNVLASHKNLVLIRPTASTVDVDADEILLEDTSGNIYKASSVNLTADITSSGANGLDTGTEASDTWYYLWVIYDGTTVASLISTSSTSPTMPSGYTFKGLVGAVRNDGSSNFLDFFQYGKEAFLDVLIQDVNDTSPGTSANLATHTCPPNVWVVFTASMISAADDRGLISSTDQTDTAPTTSIYNIRAGSGANVSQVEFTKRADASSQTRYRFDNATADLEIYTQGWRWE